MTDKLDEICARKHEHIAKAQERTPLSALEEIIKTAPPPRGFCDALRRQKAQGGHGLIAEIKKASPSKGVIRPDFDPKKIAKSYELAGTTCLSVLTDEPYFQGRDLYLQQAHAASNCPALRKDFMLTPYQIYESRALGADCVLLIVAALTQDNLVLLYKTARDLGMDVLVEVHDSAELTRAAALDAAMIGVNCRNLRSLAVNPALFYELAPAMPAGALRIAESGIGTHDDLLALEKAGYDAFLVGESLMRQDDIVAATQALLGQKTPPHLTQKKN